MNYTTKITIDASSAQCLLSITFDKAVEAIEKLKKANIYYAYTLTRAEMDSLAATSDSARDNLYMIMKLLDAMADAEKKFEAEKKGGEA